VTDVAPAAPLFAFNDDAEVTVLHIGRSGIAVTRIDNVLHAPQSVAALGFEQPYVEDRGNLYPGLRAPIPPDLSTALRTWLTRTLQRNGILKSDQIFQRDSSFYSIVTTAAEDLLPIQRIPHYDSTDPGLFAAVIYLCDTRFSGTSFYRHRKTGYEEITSENQGDYRLALDRELRIHGPPPKGYINADSSLFEVVFSNQLTFNSAIVYPARALHAANIGKRFEPPKEKSEWRLTLTALLHVSHSA
jgi:hypothetical protein